MPRNGVQTETAEAIKEAINNAAGGTFDTTPTAVRSWADWDEKLEDLATLHVDVVPAGVESLELENRGELVYRVLTDIGVRKRFEVGDTDAATGRIDQAELDALDLLTEQLHEFFATDRLDDYDKAVHVESDLRVPFVREHLRSLGQWTSIVRVTHDVTKTIGAA